METSALLRPRQVESKEFGDPRRAREKAKAKVRKDQAQRGAMGARTGKAHTVVGTAATRINSRTRPRNSPSRV